MHPWLLLPSDSPPLHFPSASLIPESPRWSYEPQYLPSKAERGAALVTLTKLAADLEACERFLRSLKQAEEHAYDMRDKLLAAQLNYSMLGVWSKRLPTEVMSTIFSMLDNDTYAEQSHWAARTLPLVCQRWKSIAEATLSMWNGQVFHSKVLPVSMSLPSVKHDMYLNPKINCPLVAKCMELKLAR
jgi:hypothetical protein